ncbi:MAG: hypothetical protein U0797_15055 [Gemmataceae bacterium]
MRSKHSFRPVVEGLEDRWVPATIRLVAGNLFVSNQVGELTVSTTGTAGQITVNDFFNATDHKVTLSGVGSLISITGTNLANKINFVADVAGGKLAFPGNLLINSGNGIDTVDLTGRIGGNVTLLTGLGNDIVTSTGDLSIGGGLTFSDGFGLNTVNLNDQDWIIGGNLTMSGVGTFNSGTGNMLKVGGAVTLAATPTVANPLNVTFNAGSLVDIGKSLTITGSAVTDSVQVLSLLSVGGNMSVNLRGGLNTFFLTPTTGGTGINGSLFYIGNGDADTVFLGDFSDVAGNTSIEMGGGANVFVDNPLSLYAGNLTVNGGNDTNTFVISGAVSGNLGVSLGNGDNNLTQVNGAIGGRFSYRLGNGSNAALNLAPAAGTTVVIDAVFGTGSSTFSLLTDFTLTGIVRGTGGSYTFDQGTATLAPTLYFINYPV